MTEAKPKKLTIQDRFDFPLGPNGENINSKILPEDSNGMYSEDPSLCGQRSPGEYHWACTAGYSHNPPHVAASGTLIVAVWEDQP